MLKERLRRIWPASKKQLSDTLNSLKKELAKTKTDLYSNTSEALKEFSTQFNAEIAKIKSDVVAETKEEIAKTKTDLYSNTSEALKEFSTQFNAEIAKIKSDVVAETKEEIAKTKTDLYSNTSEALKEFSMRFNTEIANIKIDLHSDTTAIFNELSTQFNTESEKLKNGIEICKDNIGKISTVQEDYETKLCNIVQENFQESHSVDLQLKNDFQDWKQKHEIQLNNMARLMRENMEFPLGIAFERKFYSNFSLVPSEKLKTDFLKLIDGLDSKSVEAVVRALLRLKFVLNTTQQYADFYSSEEKKAAEEIRDYFKKNILPLADDCFYCNGYFLPINHFESCVFWDKCCIEELEYPERFQDKDIIDAGVYIGDSALVLSAFTQKKVYSFEPSPINYELMLKTIGMNKKENVVPCPFALGEKIGKTNISLMDSASNLFAHPAWEYKDSAEVDVTTIDDYVRENNLLVGLIKSDLEGAEQLMLRGAMETIKTQKPALLISIYHTQDDFFKIKPMLEELNLGYKFKIRKPVTGTVMTEMMLIAEVK